MIEKLMIKVYVASKQKIEMNIHYTFWKLHRYNGFLLQGRINILIAFCKEKNLKSPHIIVWLTCNYMLLTDNLWLLKMVILKYFKYFSLNSITSLIDSGN